MNEKKREELKDAGTRELEARRTRLASMGNDQVIEDVLAELKLIREEAIEHCATPDKPSEARQFNSGRLAMIEDVREHLASLFKG